MGIPGLKIGTAASPAAAYGITKSMIRDNGPTFLFAPVKMMKEAKGSVDLDKCLPLNKAALLNEASDEAVNGGKAVTVLTYLHGVKEAEISLKAIQEEVSDTRITPPSLPYSNSSLRRDWTSTSSSSGPSNP